VPLVFLYSQSIYTDTSQRGYLAMQCTMYIPYIEDTFVTTLQIHLFHIHDTLNIPFKTTFCPFGHVFEGDLGSDFLGFRRKFVEIG
jgi:hypothetical protein